jgi:outer membrane protein OmpA-like peptidoglycan-associated protein
MIRWSGNPTNIGYSVDYKFNGLGSFDGEDFASLSMDVIGDSILSALTDSIKVGHPTNNPYTTHTSTKLNIGAEYAFFNNKLSVGLLSRTMFHNKAIYQELTASVNGRPIDWFNMSLSYSFMNGRMSNIGAGLGVRTGFVNWFVTADYIPLNFAPYPINVALPIGITIPAIPVPYNTKGFNVAFGVNLVFGNRKDADKDGVVDRKDKCPETPFSVIVDKDGCPLDTDGDGVPDYLDRCPGTPPEAYNHIDEYGCPVDADGDGIPDYLDKCPDTPKEAIGFVDQFGCELDSDGDGVFDYLDKCPDTPAGVPVDVNGCPFDTDGDGVYDHLDLCPDTPVEARGKVDKNGCPIDSDGDGVPDYLDLCPNTPLEARGFVDKNGCPLDSDDDGVADYLDKCPDTPIEARGMVDEKGCPRDTDGDGVPDYLDNCPKVPGLASNKGCPEVKKEVRTLFQKALQGIQFETNKYVIKPVSYKILNQIAEVLINNPTYLIEVRGHTDNVGKPDANLILSDRRAESVRLYLIGKGVSEKRMTSKGFGDTLPVATNKTAAGRALNRRVEFVVTFEEVTFE